MTPTHIKTVGFVDNKWQVILSDYTLLMGVQSIELKKDLKDGISLGSLVMRIVIDENLAYKKINEKLISESKL